MLFIPSSSSFLLSFLLILLSSTIQSVYSLLSPTSLFTKTLIPHSSIQSTSSRNTRSTSIIFATTSLNNSNNDDDTDYNSTKQLHVVLFGIGDLRAFDHGGLSSAITTTTSTTNSSRILPLCILDTIQTLPNLPMGRLQTLDTSQMIHTALQSLDLQLKTQFGLPLHVKTSGITTKITTNTAMEQKEEEERDTNTNDSFNNNNNNNNIESPNTQNSDYQTCLLEVLYQSVNELPSLEEITIHVCDLNPVDNILAYGPFAHLNDFTTVISSNTGSSSSSSTTTKRNVSIQIQPWDCELRNKPWNDVRLNPNSFPDQFPHYQELYSISSSSTTATTTTTTTTTASTNTIQNPKPLSIPTLERIPSHDEITQLLCQALNIPYNSGSDANLQLQCNTGLYATHYGGLDIPSTFTHDSVYKALDIFLGSSSSTTTEQQQPQPQDTYFVDGDEALVSKLDWWSTPNLKRNKLSLEHASIDWMMTGGYATTIETTTTSSNKIQTQNLIQGELMTRYLTMPLFFGLVSSKYIWDKAHSTQQSLVDQNFLFNLLPLLPKPTRGYTVMKTLVEGKEWHKLLAAKNLLSSSSSSSASKSVSPSSNIQCGYWIWHGFLCRYEKSLLRDVSKPTTTSTTTDQQSLILVHGFGASGSQWNKLIHELSQNKKLCYPGEEEGHSPSSSSRMNNRLQALAPDLIGFGQAEKPSLTYTQYLWESYVSAFTKEISLGKYKSSSFIVGGNSIGGYTSMGTAADDHVQNNIATTTSSIDSSNVVRSLPKVSASGAPGTGRCEGVILMNSAGRIFSKDDIEKMNVDSGSTVAEATALDMLGKCSPPSRSIATFGGNGLLWYLRPRIQSICKNLYPTNPSAVDDVLCQGILRDSLDPGAINVMISGSKLPPPRTANELLGADFGSSKNRGYTPAGTNVLSVSEASFDGPVLVAQGLLDPLNDAKGRAQQFKELRQGITLTPINGGHCPHDELPFDVATAIANWIYEKK